MFPLSAEKRMHREEEKINPVHVQQAGEAACPGVILKERQKKKEWNENKRGKKTKTPIAITPFCPLLSGENRKETSLHRGTATITL